MSIRTKAVDLKNEKKRSERLLYQLLPAQILESVKNG